MQLCNFKGHLTWWHTQHFMHDDHRVPIVPHKLRIKFMQFSHNSPWTTFPGSPHPTHPSVSRMSLSPRNSCAEWQRDHLPWWVTCDKVMYHMVNWSELPWNKASNPGHVPCWCNRRATTGLFCLRDDHPFKVSTPCEASNLKPNCSEVLTSSTSLLHCIFQRCNGLTLTTRNSKVNEVFVLLGYGAMSLDNSYLTFQDSAVAVHLPGCINTVSKCQAPVIQWCCTVFWKNEDLICTPVKTSNLTSRVYSCQGEKSTKVTLTKIIYCLYM